MKRIIVKLSGEALAGNNRFGVDATSVKKIAEDIKKLAELGYQIGIVTGAGNIWRGRDSLEFGMPKAAADNIGMVGTIINSLALENILKSIGVKAVSLSAVEANKFAEYYTREKAIKYLEEGYVVIFAGGTGNPFFTTDSTAALRAGEVGAEVILMAKNGVDGVYDSDPRTNPSAKRFTKLTYQEMLNYRLHVIDLTASVLCEENNIKTIVFDMNKEGNILKVLTNPEIGTVIE
jgi:uridylate kinase